MPNCPGWGTRDLALHLGPAHRWAAAFWSRRQAHEVTVHTVDLAQALGLPLPAETRVEASVEGTSLDLYLTLWGRAERQVLRANGRAAEAMLDGPSSV